MLLWTALLVLAPASGLFATAPKLVISLHPPWTPVFEGETVKLTCSGFGASLPRTIYWYSGRKIFKETKENTLEVGHSGDYRCAIGGQTSASDPVHLDFTTAPLVLQTPHSVFEGYSVVLRCQTRAGIKLSSVKIYKDNQLLKTLGENTEFNIPQASLRHSGAYRCTGVTGNFHEVYSSEVKIQVKELFSRPVLADSLSETRGGTQVTLSCKTQLSPQKSDIRLQFCFFRNNKALEWGCSNNPGLQISAVWPDYSGSYQCKAGAVISKVWKESQISHIHVQKADIKVQTPTQLASTPIAEGQELLLICLVGRNSANINFSWFMKDVQNKKNQISRGPKYKISAVQPSHTGQYYCQAGQFISKPLIIKVKAPVSQPVLTLSTSRAQFAEGEQMNFRCEVKGGSPEILYQFFHEDQFLREIKTISRLVRISLTAEHSGNYYCTANNGFGPNRSEALKISVIVPVSQPVLKLHTTEDETVEGDMVTLHCETHRGSLSILYQFYYEDALLDSSLADTGTGASYSFSLTTKHSGNYYCTANNSISSKQSNTVNLAVIVPVSPPVFALRMPRVPAVVGDVAELDCEAPRGSPPILYQFYLEDVMLGSIQSPYGGRASFKLPLTEEHSGSYLCEASNVRKAQRSNTLMLDVKGPVSHPVLTLRAPRAQAVVGDMVELHCEALRGSPPILYQLYHEDVILRNSSAPSGGGVSFNLSLTSEHSGNYSCEADNGLEAQRSELMSLKVTVPVSRPVLTLRVPRPQAVVGDEMELHCEALRGTPPIWYRFYHENVTLRNDSTFSGKGVSFNFSLTAEHSGNYSCEADNGLGAQQSEVVTLFIPGLTKNRRGTLATGVTGALLSMVGFAAAGALLFYFWFSRKAGDKSALDFSRNPSDSNSQEATYHNVPGWIELQPVYLNVNPRGQDVVYSEVRRHGEENKHTASSRPRSLRNEDSSVIYSQVKVACTPASRARQSVTSAPHR